MTDELRLAQPWSGDDQEWWDWYVTLADNPDGPDDAAGPPPPVATTGGGRPATIPEVAAALSEPYPLTAEAVGAFRRDGFVKLPGVVPGAVLAALGAGLERLLDGDGPGSGRLVALEQMWLGDELMDLVARSSRLGDIAATLLGADGVRLYHDNALAKQAGCGRTPWHRDADHFPLATTQVATAWIPLHPVPAAMGPLAFARGRSVTERLEAIALDVSGTTYDRRVSELLDRSDVEDTPYASGEVSFHSARCFHTAGANRTTVDRWVLSTIYFADGARVVDEPTMLSGRWRDFVPGREPGQLADSPANPVVGHDRPPAASGPAPG